MGAAKKIEDPFDTLWLLQMKYRKPVVAIEELLPDYLPHLSLVQANKRANKCEPYRVCRRLNILRDYPDDKIKIYP